MKKMMIGFMMLSACMQGYADDAVLLTTPVASEVEAPIEVCPECANVQDPKACTCKAAEAPSTETQEQGEPEPIKE